MYVCMYGPVSRVPESVSLGDHTIGGGQGSGVRTHIYIYKYETSESLEIYATLFADVSCYGECIQKKGEQRRQLFFDCTTCNRCILERNHQLVEPHFRNVISPQVPVRKGLKFCVAVK